MKRIVLAVLWIPFLSVWCKNGYSQTLSLDSCIHYGLEHNKALLAKSGDIAIEAAKRKNTQLALYPDVLATSGMDYYWKIPVQMFPAEIIGGQQGSFVPVKLGLPYIGNYGATAELSLVDVEKWQNIKRALLQEKLAGADVESYKYELARNIKLSYYQALLQQRSAALSDSLYHNYAVTDTLIQQKYNEGIVDKITVNQSSNILSDRHNQLLKAKAQLEIAFLNLKIWMGYPLNKTFSIREQDCQVPAYDDFEQEKLPALSLQQLKVDDAYRLLKTARNSWYPRLKLQAAYTETGYSNKLQFVSGFDWFPSGYAGLQLRFSFSDLYRLKAQIQEKKAVWEQSKIHYQEYIEQGQKEFYEQKALVAQYQAILYNNGQAIQRARESEQLTMQKLQNDIIDMTQIKQVTDDWYRLQESYNTNWLNYISALVQMEYLQHKNQHNEK